MANRKNWLGLLVIVLVFGMMVVGCGDGGDGGSGSNPLIGKWYYTQETADAGTYEEAYEFTSDGKLLISGTDQGFTYTVSGKTLTVNTSGVAVGTTTFSITGTELTIDSMFVPFILQSKYYKAAGSGSGGNSQGLNAAINILKSWGYTGTFYTPDRGTFDRYYDYGDWLAIIFKNSSTSDFTAYRNKWRANIANNIANNRAITADDGFTLWLNNIYAQVYFTPGGGTADGITLPPNSIVFMAYNDY